MKYLIALLPVVMSCTQQDRGVVINWRDNKPVSISVAAPVAVYDEHLLYPVLGDLTKEQGQFVFTPAVPFQRELTYLAISRSDTLRFTIPGDTAAHAPSVVATYPSCETVPSNLLKVYVRFSEPMQEYRSSEFVRMFDVHTGDTIKNAFLDLKPELWNEDGTVLTLWVDPGRIKRDLIPNKVLGTVLKDHNSYRLEVGAGWMSKKGKRSVDKYERVFTTSVRDTDRPDVRQWRVTANPQKITIDTNESLDWMLVGTSISIRSENRRIQAKTFSEVCERQLLITPDRQLEKGTYTLDIQAALEDLAGNNLNRLFETDVTTSSKNSINKEVYSLTFDVH